MIRELFDTHDTTTVDVSVLISVVVGGLVRRTCGAGVGDAARRGGGGKASGDPAEAPPVELTPVGRHADAPPGR